MLYPKKERRSVVFLNSELREATDRIPMIAKTNFRFITKFTTETKAVKTQLKFDTCFSSAMSWLAWVASVDTWMSPSECSGCAKMGREQNFHAPRKRLLYSVHSIHLFKQRTIIAKKHLKPRNYCVWVSGIYHVWEWSMIRKVSFVWIRSRILFGWIVPDN